MPPNSIYSNNSATSVHAIQVSLSSWAETGDGGRGARTTSTASRTWKLDDSFRPLIPRTTGRTLAVCTCSMDNGVRESAFVSTASNLSSLTEGASTLLTYLLTYIFCQLWTVDDTATAMKLNWTVHLVFEIYTDTETVRRMRNTDICSWKFLFIYFVKKLYGHV